MDAIVDRRIALKLRIHWYEEAEKRLDEEIDVRWTDEELLDMYKDTKFYVATEQAVIVEMMMENFKSELLRLSTTTNTGI